MLAITLNEHLSAQLNVMDAFQEKDYHYPKSSEQDAKIRQKEYLPWDNESYAIVIFNDEINIELQPKTSEYVQRPVGTTTKKKTIPYIQQTNWV